MASIWDILATNTTGDLHCWSLPNVRGEGKERWIGTRQITRLESYAKKRDEPSFGTFFCVSTVRPGQSRKKEHAVELPWLFVDIDFKNFDLSPAEIERILHELPFPPSRIHHTGGGLHAFWILTAPIHADGMDEAEVLLRCLANHLGGDPMVAHRVALLRVPNTHNSKRSPEGEQGVLVAVAKEGNERYSLDQIKSWLGAAREPVLVQRGRETNPFIQAAGNQSFRPPIDVAQRLRDMCHGGEGETAIHTTQLSCAASLMSAGVDIDEAVAMILEATKLVGDPNWNWKAEERAIRGMCKDWLKKHPQDATPGTVSLREATSKRDEGVNLNDFQAYMPMHNYIYTPTREPWPASSVDARLPEVPLFASDGTPVRDEKGKQKKVSPSRWLDKNRAVEQMTWAPGQPMLIRDCLISDGGFVQRTGVTVLNLYRPPTIELGDSSQAQPWLDHVRKVYPENTDHIVRWLAQRVQRPGEKVNHALVLGGDQGIGKDTLLDAAKQAVGPWNFIEVSPKQTLGRFNGFLKSTILRISEARDTGGEGDRFQFYEHTKVYTAAPPDVLRVDEKNLREYNIINCCGVVITTNRKDSLYLPPDDRRHYVAWSNLTKDDFSADYWKEIWSWYEREGYCHVAAYLTRLDLSEFNPKAPPPKTEVFWQVVEVNRTTESSEFAHVLDGMGNPTAVTLPQLAEAARSSVFEPSAAFDGDFYSWLVERKNRRQIPHRMEDCGYVPVRNQTRKDGLWKVGGRAQAIYARKDLSFREQYVAATDLTRTLSQEGDAARQ